MYAKRLLYVMPSCTERASQIASRLSCGGGTSTGHIPEGVFHAIAGGNGHFRAGFYDTVYNIADVYETALKPYGLTTGIGSGRNPRYKYTPRLISNVLA